MIPLSVRAAAGWSVTPGSCRVFRVENHDEALPVRRDCAGTGRVLVHVDARHAMWWVRERIDAWRVR